MVLAFRPRLIDNFAVTEVAKNSPRPAAYRLSSQELWVMSQDLQGVCLR